MCVRAATATLEKFITMSHRPRHSMNQRPDSHLPHASSYIHTSSFQTHDYCVRNHAATLEKFMVMSHRLEDLVKEDVILMKVRACARACARALCNCVWVASACRGSI